MTYESRREWFRHIKLYKGDKAQKSGRMEQPCMACGEIFNSYFKYRVCYPCQLKGTAAKQKLRPTGRLRDPDVIQAILATEARRKKK